MSIRRPLCCTLLVLAALAGGCSTSGPGEASRDSACLRDRAGCMHEGSYEPGERAYAEEEASRLNQAQLSRMRRW